MLAAELSTKNMFILSRHSFDTTSTGVNYVYWAVSDNGPIKLTFTHQEPVLFIDKNVQLPEPIRSLIQSRKALKMLAINWFGERQMVDALYFSSLNKASQFKRWAESNEVEVFESDVVAHERFLMERFIFGSCIVKGFFKQHDGFFEVVNGEIKAADYSPNLSTASIDIETNESASQIYSIAMDSAAKKMVWVVTNEPLSTIHHPSESTQYQLQYVANEKELLVQFFAVLNALDPDVIIGWNVIGFDIRVLSKKCEQYALPLALGRGHRHSQFKSAMDNDYGNTPRAFVDGRVILDGIECLRGAFYQFESFSLDFVAQALLKKEKMIDKSVDKMAEINRMFIHDKPRLAHYNYIDTQLVSEIFTKTSMIDFLVAKTKMTGLNLGRLGGSVAAFDFIYLPKLHRNKVVAQNVGRNHFNHSSPGGYVLPSMPGMYDNVALLDFKSLYPSIIRTFFVDPFGLFKAEVIAPKRLRNDSKDNLEAHSMLQKQFVSGYENALFVREDSILPDIIDRLWRLRDSAKLDKNLPLSQAIKIIMNSFYGVLGTPQCRFYHPKLASSITKRGHEIILKTKAYIESQGWQVIYGDTDSLFIHFGSTLNEAQAKENANDLMQKINAWWQKTLQDRYQITSYLEMEFETLFAKFYMPTIRGSESGSKKRYAGWVNSNGQGQLVMKGLEAVRTDWVALAKEMQVDLMTKIFTNKPYLDDIKRLVNSMNAGELDDKLIFKKSLRKPVDQYTKNVPPHVQAAKKMQSIKQNRNFRGKIAYVMTEHGAEPIEKLTESGTNIRLDYHYYLEHQIRPALESILQSVGDDFESIISNQRRLF